MEALIGYIVGMITGVIITYTMRGNPIVRIETNVTQPEKVVIEEKIVYREVEAPKPKAQKMTEEYATLSDGINQHLNEALGEETDE